MLMVYKKIHIFLSAKVVIGCYQGESVKKHGESVKNFILGIIDASKPFDFIGFSFYSRKP